MRWIALRQYVVEKRQSLLIYLSASLMTITISVLGSFNKMYYLLVLAIILSGFIVMVDNAYRALLFFTVTAYMLFSYGVTNVGVKLQGIFFPMGEIVLLLGLIRMFILFDKDLLKALFSNKNIMIFNMIFAIFVIRVPFGIYKYGSIAIRDGSHYIELLYFVIITYELLRMAEADFKRQVIRLFIIALNLMFAYSLLLPLQEQILKVSPVISGYQYQIPLFGFFPIAHMWLLVLIMSNLFLVIEIVSRPWVNKLLHIQNLIALLLIFITSSRVTLLTYVVFIICSMFINKKISLYLIQYLIVFGVSLMILLSFNISIHSMRGEIDFYFIKNAVLSCFGQGEHQEMASGYDLRVRWIKSLIFNNSFYGMLFGKGFGNILTDFRSNGGVVVREPHNSIISIFSRMGGIVLILWFKNIASFWLLSFRSIKSKSQNYFFYMSVILIMASMINSLAEPFFEFSYGAVPFYALLAIFVFDYKGDSDAIRSTNRELHKMVISHKA